MPAAPPHDVPSRPPPVCGLRRGLLRDTARAVSVLGVAQFLPSLASGSDAPTTPAPVAIELLRAERDDEGVRLDFRLRVSLPAPVRQALERGVPLYFTATALLKEERWWWRDRRLVRVERSWRLAYLPLASTWRVGLSGLTQAADTLDEALALFSRVAGWRVADRDLLAQMTPEARHHIEFSFGLDTSRLPGLMQIGLAEQADWNVSARRRVSLPRS